MPKTATLSIKALKAAALFSSTEETRYYLKGVFVTITADASRYVATDGHRMLVHREDLIESADRNTLLGSWIVPAESIAAIKGGTGRFDNVPATLTELDEGKFSLEAPKGAVLFRPIDGSFPDFHRVIPAAIDAKEISGRPQFNGQYYASFAKAAELLGYGANTPHFHFNGEGSPCPVTFGPHQTIGVIMPVRNTAPLWGGAPAWASLDPKVAPAALAAE